MAQYKYPPYLIGIFFVSMSSRKISGQMQPGWGTYEPKDSISWCVSFSESVPLTSLSISVRVVVIDP